MFLAGPDQTSWYIGSGINGAASAIMMLGWGYYLCSIDSRHSAFTLTLGFAIYALSTWLLSAVPSQFIIMFMAVFPLLSYLSLQACVKKSITQTGAAYPMPKKSRSLIPWDIVSMLAICTIISILAKLLVPASELSTSHYLVFWPLILILILGFYAVWLIVLKRQDQDAVWPLFILIIFSGLLCYSSLAATQPAFAKGFFKATQECFMLFCWIVTASAVYRLKLPRVFFFGLSVLVFLEPPTLVSSLVSFVLPANNTPDINLFPVIATTILAFSLVVASVVLIITNMIRTHRHEDRETLSGHTQNTVQGALERLASRHGLTKRESEIAGFLIRGYTFPQIASTLYLSIDTVRTHIKSLYRKIGIHKKQQLIAMVEREQATTHPNIRVES